MANANPTRKKTAGRGKPRSSAPPRPAGQRSDDGGVQRKELPRCARCGGTELRIIKKIGEQHHQGFDRAGRPYTSIVRQRARCQTDGCGQVQVLTARRYVPELWRGEQPSNAPSTDGEPADPAAP